MVSSPRTQKQRKILCYTGIGSNPDGVHSPEEFLTLTKTFSKSKDDCTSLKTGKYICPPKGNIKGWMKWTGAEYIDEKTCRKEANTIQHDKKKTNAHTRKVVKKGLANIRSGKYYKQQRSLNEKRGLPVSHTRKIVKQMEKIYKKMEKNLQS